MAFNADGFELFGGNQKDGEASPSSGFLDEMHQFRQQQGVRLVRVASDSQSAGGFSAGTAFNYMGYITYAGLMAGAFGHDDPLQIETRATRFFQEKILHQHAINNPQVWVAMGDLMMSDQHLLAQGAKVKPVKLHSLTSEAKHESEEQKHQRKDFEHNAKDAQQTLKDITSGLKAPDDYVLAAKSLYIEAIAKADARAAQEAIDHKDEKRLAGRLTFLSGEPDRVAANQAKNNSVNPLEDELGARVSLRLETATFLDQFGSHVPELGWTAAAAKLRDEALAIYNDPKALSYPVRQRLQHNFPNELKDKPQGNIV